MVKTYLKLNCCSDNWYTAHNVHNITTLISLIWVVTYSRISTWFPIFLLAVDSDFFSALTMTQTQVVHCSAIQPQQQHALTPFHALGNYQFCKATVNKLVLFTSKANISQLRCQHKIDVKTVILCKILCCRTYIKITLIWVKNKEITNKIHTLQTQWNLHGLCSYMTAECRSSTIAGLLFSVHLHGLLCLQFSPFHLVDVETSSSAWQIAATAIQKLKKHWKLEKVIVYWIQNFKQ